jgi:hypothetical protein
MHPSAVLRYADGEISRAAGHEWDERNGGRLVRRKRRPDDDDGCDTRDFYYEAPSQEKTTPLALFDVASVWACGQPVVVVRCDPARTQTVRRDEYPRNSLHNRHLYGDDVTWSLLHFRHPGRPVHAGSGTTVADDDAGGDAAALCGGSQVTTRFHTPGGGDERVGSSDSGDEPGAPHRSRNYTYVAGGDPAPSWLGPLVPGSFRRPGQQQQQQQQQGRHDGARARERGGLGGLLAVLIGLMALAGCGRREEGADLVADLFAPAGGHRGAWHRHRWRPRGRGEKGARGDGGECVDSLILAKKKKNTSQ